MKNLAITVAIPTYNRGKSVADLVHKLTPQLSEADEMLVVDDASKDDTVELLSKIPQVKLISKATNGGMVKNWNTCLTSAAHDWICIIHDDDIVTASTIQTIKRAISTVNEPVLIRHNSLGAEFDQCFRYKVLEAGAWAVLQPFLTPSGVTIHRDIVNAVGLFNENLSYSPDIEYFARVCSMYTSMIIESPKILSFNFHSQNYEYKTWSKPDFMAQLEEIERLLLAYAGVNEVMASKLFGEHMNQHISHMLGFSPTSDNKLLLQQIGWIISKKSYLNRKNRIKAYFASFLNWCPNI
jgi:glycosyltransferase involved in cell wall biosynthesis